MIQALSPSMLRCMSCWSLSTRAWQRPTTGSRKGSTAFSCEYANTALTCQATHTFALGQGYSAVLAECEEHSLPTPYQQEAGSHIAHKMETPSVGSSYPHPGLSEPLRRHNCCKERQGREGIGRDGKETDLYPGSKAAAL